MPVIENTTEHQHDISAKVGDDFQNVSVPRGNGESGANRVNGSVEVSDEFLKSAMTHKVVAHWFENGDLILGKAKAKAHAPVEDHGHHKK